MFTKPEADRFALVFLIFSALYVWQDPGVPPRGLLVAMLTGGAVLVTLIESVDAGLCRRRRLAGGR